MSGFYKVLNSNLTSRNGGTYQWVLGEWAPEIAGELVPCENGYHVCQEDDLPNWLGPVICEAEIGGQVLRRSGKTVARTARIVKVLGTWNKRTARLFACDCAEQVLPVFESQRPDDDRPRTAIEAARLFARGEATADGLAAARDAAWDAARDAAWAAARAARDAAWAAARAAAWAAAGDAAAAARDAARAAARAAAWAAAGDAERRWQTERLMAYLRGEVDLMSGCCGGKAAESVLGAIAENARYMTPEEAERYWPLERQGEGATAYVPATEHVWPEVPDGPTIKDSGEREQFPSGMVRDVRRGKGRYDLISPYTMRRLAKIMEKGCEKYGERNWEQGAPADRFLDSCLRHLGQWQMGMHDEDHLGQALWNLHCIVHFDEIEYGQTPDAENLTSSKGWHE